MEDCYAHLGSRIYDSIGDSNLRYLPGNDSRNDSKLERRVIGMTVIGVIDMTLAGGLRCWWRSTVTKA